MQHIDQHGPLCRNRRAEPEKIGGSASLLFAHFSLATARTGIDERLLVLGQRGPKVGKPLDDFPRTLRLHRMEFTIGQEIRKTRPKGDVLEAQALLTSASAAPAGRRR